MSTRTKPWSRRKGKAKKKGHYDDGRVQHWNPSSTNDIPVAPRHDRRLQCAGKKPYSPAAARGVANRLNERNSCVGSEFAGLTVRPYTCPWCACVHVGRFASMGLLELSPVDVPGE